VSPPEFVRVTVRLEELAVDAPMMLVPAVRLVPHDRDEAYASTDQDPVSRKR
jgi:hypothetical protein